MRGEAYVNIKGASIMSIEWIPAAVVPSATPWSRVFPLLEGECAWETSASPGWRTETDFDLDLVDEDEDEEFEDEEFEDEEFEDEEFEDEEDLDEDFEDEDEDFDDDFDDVEDDEGDLDDDDFEEEEGEY